MRVFQVIKPGLFTTVQDLGRYGFLRYGVPISGAMDQFSMAAANLLVENNLNDACLEITLIGPEFQALVDTQIAVTGGDCSPRVNGENVSMWRTLAVRDGDVVSFGRMRSGCRAYVSIRGGFDVPIVLGSRSTYVRGGFGGVDGRQLKAQVCVGKIDVTPLEHEYSLPENDVPRFRNRVKAHVIRGPQANMFKEEGISTFLSSRFTVSLEADRMGYRLEGPLVEHKDGANIVSDALLPGVVQVPRSGKPIVIMRDGQTTGGYAKIAVVIGPDVDFLGQARPNDVVEFSEITLEEAYVELAAYRRLVDSLKDKLARK